MKKTASTLSTSGLLLMGALSAHAQTDVGPQVQVDSFMGTPMNETSIAVSDSAPLDIVASWNDYRIGGEINLGVGLSLDGGDTWSDFLIQPPAGFTASTEGDPMTAADARTGAIWVGAISFSGNGGIFVARKDAGATAFNAPVMARISGGTDKCWMEAGPVPGNPDSTRLYIAYNEGLIYSDDLGETWTDPLFFASGIGFLPRIGPNGELYITYWDFFDGVMLARSLNGGVSFDPPIRIATRMEVWFLDGNDDPFAGSFRVAALNGLAVDPNDGALYCTWSDGSGVVSGSVNIDLYFSKSVDQGSTWSTPVVINGDGSTPGDQFFSFIDVDAKSRIHQTFYDTRANPLADTQSPALVDAYYSYSDDGGANWTESRLTPNAWNSDFDGIGGIFIGDYLGLASAGNRTWPLYMSTQNGEADMFTHSIQEGPGFEFCFGVVCPCTNNDPSAGCMHSGGVGGRLQATGSASVLADDLVLTASDLPTFKPSLLLMGATKRDLPFSDGRLCVGPGGGANVIRFPAKFSGASGSIVEGPGVVAQSMSFPPAANIQAGQTWNFQAYFRDATGPCASGANTTNAVAVDFDN